MIRALLSGAKTQTRRVVKPMAGQQKGWLTPELLNRSPSVKFGLTSSKDGPRDPGVQLEHPRGGPLGWIRSPFGGPGDKLWCRETFTKGDGEGPEFAYRADGWTLQPGEKWTPAIFMPRTASRITLEITEVRVERVQNITPDDCRAEGMPKDNTDTGVRYCYGSLWNQLNEGRGCGWNANPYVWVLEFKRITP